MLPADVGKSASPKNRFSTLTARLSGTLAPLSFLLILSLFLSMVSRNFATRDNLKQIAIQAAVVAILACGQTAVIISGNIDLSVGAMMAFSGVAAAQAMKAAQDPSVAPLPLWLSMLVALPFAYGVALLLSRANANRAETVKRLAATVGFLVIEGIMTVVFKGLLPRLGGNMWGAVLISLLCGLSVGMLNGLLTAFGKIPSFIVTLGMMGLAYGGGSIVANSQNVSGFAPGFDVFGRGELFGSATRDGLPYAVLTMIAVAALVYFALTKTLWGRRLYAMGGNQESSRLSGISLTWSTTSVFALSGLLAGVAGVVSISRVSIAEYNAGLSYELYAVAATVIGGTSLFGGQGGIPGTIIGAFLMFTISNGCNLNGLGSDYERAVIGAVVILAVLYDRYGLPWVRAKLTPKQKA